MFEKVGKTIVRILEAYCAEANKFEDTPANAIAIAVEVQEIDGPGEGAWTGEVSDRYGIGNAAGKTQTEMTCQSLISTGWDCGMTAEALVNFVEQAHHIEDYEAINNLLASMAGIETTATIAETKKGNLIVKYIGGGSWKPKRLVKRATPGGDVGDAFA